MPIIYRRTEHISEINGHVRNGVAVVAHVPDDVSYLEGLVDSVARLPGDPLANLYRVLNNAGRSPAIWPRAEHTFDMRADASGESRESRDSTVASLRLSLSLGRTIWRQQRDDFANLSLALVIPRPGHRAVIDTRRPGLVLDHGSIRARVLAAGGRLRDFGVALFPVARAKRRSNVVESLRDNAPGLRLPRLETVQL